MKLGALLITVLLAVPSAAAPSDPADDSPVSGKRSGGSGPTPAVRWSWKDSERLDRRFPRPNLPVRANQSELGFDLANGEGSFRGRMQDGVINGHWTPPNSVVHGFSTRRLSAWSRTAPTAGAAR